MGHHYWTMRMLVSRFTRLAVVTLVLWGATGCIRQSLRLTELPSSAAVGGQQDLHKDRNPSKQASQDKPSGGPSPEQDSGAGAKEVSVREPSANESRAQVVPATHRIEAGKEARDRRQGGQSPSARKSATDLESEARRVKSIAHDLAEKAKSVKKIRLCHNPREHEWAIVLYQDVGPYFELKQYFWKSTKDQPEPFLVSERVSKVAFDEHLRKSEPGHKCQLFDPSQTTGFGALLANTEVAPKKTALGSAPAQEKTPREGSPGPSGDSNRLRDKPAPAAPVQPGPVARTTRTSPQPRPDGPDPRVAEGSPATTRSPSPIQKPPAEKPVYRQASAGPGTLKVHPERRHPIHEAEGIRPAKQESRPPTPKSAPTEAPIQSPAFRTASDTPQLPTYHIFAYGSKMNHSELLAWLENNGYDSSLVREVTPGVLEGYDFVWNYYSQSRKSGAVNLEPRKNFKIWGLLVEIEDPLLKAFDEREGHPMAYSRGEERVAVRRLEDNKTVFAWLYRARSNTGGRKDIWPTEQYKKKVLDAAMFWGFPEEYLQRIRSWKTR